MTKETALLKELLKDYQKPEDLLREDGLLKKLSKQAMELALEAEMEQHLGYGKHEPSGRMCRPVVGSDRRGEILVIGLK